MQRLEGKNKPQTFLTLVPSPPCARNRGAELARTTFAYLMHTCLQRRHKWQVPSKGSLLFARDPRTPQDAARIFVGRPCRFVKVAETQAPTGGGRIFWLAFFFSREALSIRHADGLQIQDMVLNEELPAWECLRWFFICSDWSS